MSYQQIKVTMLDTLNNKEVTRDIDISNIYIDNGTCWQVATSPERQRELLNEWIEDRANDQHETILELVSWYLF